MSNSISHHNFSSSTVGDKVSDGVNPQDLEDMAKFHIKNMYNSKFVNPHDIAGTKGIVTAQRDELENKKVINDIRIRCNRN